MTDYEKRLLANGLVPAKPVEPVKPEETKELVEAEVESEGKEDAPKRPHKRG